MKATVKKFGNKFEIIGLASHGTVKGVEMYEMRYLFTFGGKHYKTENNAINAILKKGFEFIRVTDNQLLCAYD